MDCDQKQYSVCSVKLDKLWFYPTKMTNWSGLAPGEWRTWYTWSYHRFQSYVHFWTCHQRVTKYIKVNNLYVLNKWIQVSWLASINKNLQKSCLAKHIQSNICNESFFAQLYLRLRHWVPSMEDTLLDGHRQTPSMQIIPVENPAHCSSSLQHPFSAVMFAVGTKNRIITQWRAWNYSHSMHCYVM